MLQVSPNVSKAKPKNPGRFQSINFDPQKPLDFKAVNRLRISKYKTQNTDQLPILLTTSLPTETCSQLNQYFQPLGMELIPLSSDNTNGQTEKQFTETDTLKPGSPLAIPLISGDISMAAVGTVTEVIDDKVFAFGHSFLGYGQIDLPMATAKVHTVIATTRSSYKMASAEKIIGAIRNDQFPAISGLIGTDAKLIPTKITVTRYNQYELENERTYNCQLAVNTFYTPLVLQSALIGSATMQGPLPPEHMLKYKATVEIEGFDTISFENISCEAGFREFTGEAAGVVDLLINNPYKSLDINSLSFELVIVPKNINSIITDLNLSDSTVTPGETIDVSVIVQPYLLEKKLHQLKFTIPNDLQPGKYEITAGGGYEYENFLKKTVPHRFKLQDITSMVDALRNILKIRRDTLYLTMTLPTGGVTIENNELPYLPQTKTLLLSDPKRTTAVLPYQYWVEKNMTIPEIIINKKTATITVENP